MQRGAAAEKADAESLRPISAESASCPNFPAKRNKRRDSNPQGCEAEETRRRPKPIRTKSALHLEISTQFRKASRMQQPGNHRPRESGDTGLGLSRVPHEQEAT